MLPTLVALATILSLGFLGVLSRRQSLIGTAVVALLAALTSLAMVGRANASSPQELAKGLAMPAQPRESSSLPPYLREVTPVDIVPAPELGKILSDMEEAKAPPGLVAPPAPHREGLGFDPDIDEELAQFLIRQARRTTEPDQRHPGPLASASRRTQRRMTANKDTVPGRRLEELHPPFEADVQTDPGVPEILDVQVADTVRDVPLVEVLGGDDNE